MRTSHLLILAALVLAQSVSAVEMLTIGGVKKNSQGLLRNAESGDVACYLTLEDLDGKAFTELAEFELCEIAPQWIGSQVKLNYIVGSVMADSCQGNPDCTKSVKAELVSELKPISKRASTLCQANEFEVFGCAVAKNKLVNVCADREDKPNRLQYRFGKSDAIELMLPASANYPNSTTYGRNETFAGGGGAWLRFSNNAYAYVVYTGIGRWGKNGETRTKSGVVVEQNGKQITNLSCLDPVRSQLGPSWFEQAGMDRDRNDEFYFPD